MVLFLNLSLLAAARYLLRQSPPAVGALPLPQLINVLVGVLQLLLPLHYRQRILPQEW